MNVYNTTRALSGQQPWPWLIVNGLKDCENRSWHTKIRGHLAIHAGKKFDRDGYLWVKRNFSDIVLPEPDEFECGGIVGSANIVDCVDESESRWFAGPFGLVLADARPCTFIPCRGELGFFQWKQCRVGR